jgi:hypothetical protein
VLCEDILPILEIVDEQLLFTVVLCDTFGLLFMFARQIKFVLLIWLTCAELFIVVVDNIDVVAMCATLVVAPMLELQVILHVE